MLARASGSACPVQAPDAWLHASDIRFGPVFRKVDRWGNVEHMRLRTDPGTPGSRGSYAGGEAGDGAQRQRQPGTGGTVESYPRQLD